MLQYHKSSQLPFWCPICQQYVNILDTLGHLKGHWVETFRHLTDSLNAWDIQKVALMLVCHGSKIILPQLTSLYQRTVIFFSNRGKNI